MTFYEKIIQELEHREQSLSTVYDYAFRFTNETLFEWEENGRICTMTYGAAQRRIETASAALHERLSALPKGTPIGIYLPNGTDWVISFWAILRAGFFPLLLNTNAPEGTADRCMKEAGAAYVVAVRNFDGAETIDPQTLSSASGQDFCDWADEILLCTSGTTGDPQVIAFDGKAVCAQIRNSGYVLRHNRTVATFYHGHIKLLAFLPFYHIFGLSAVLLWFSCFGRTLVLLPSLSPDVIAQTCRRHEVTHIFALPIFWNTVADGILRGAKRTGQSEKLEKGIRLSLALQNGPFPVLGQRLARGLMRSVQTQALGTAVRFCITGGGAIRTDTMRIINGVGYPLYNGYGMTEIGIASVELRKKAGERMEGTVGRLFPSMEGKLGDTLQVRGWTCFCARYENGVRIPHDPMEWFDTQDCLTDSGDGLLTFAGRQDDMLNGENGERIAPATIEAAFGCPQVAQLCVLSLPRGDGKSDVALIVEPRQRNAYALGTLAKALYEKNETLPPSYRVTKILFSEAPLPLAPTMKVQVSKVRAKIAAGTLPLTEAPRGQQSQQALYTEGMDDVLPRVIAVFREVTGMENVTPDSHFVYDLGGDSLLYFSLLEQLSEAFGMSFDGNDLNTPRAVAAYILNESE